MRWLARLFASQQVRDCRFALDALDVHFEGEWAWPQVKASVKHALMAEQKQVRSRMIVGSESALDVVGDMVAVTCLNDIETGQHHVYRGTLNQTGQSMRNIFAKIVTEQVRTGRIDFTEAGIANENMKRAVAEAG